MSKHGLAVGPAGEYINTGLNKNRAGCGDREAFVENRVVSL